MTRSLTRLVANQPATAHRPSLLPISAPMSGPLATSAAPLHSSLIQVASPSVILFSSADSSPPAFNPLSHKCAPSLFSLPDAEKPLTSSPLTASFEIRDKVISVAIDYARYYWRRRDIFVDLPLRVAVTARRPQTKLCEVIYDVRVSCSREWYYNFDDANPLSLDPSDELAALCCALAATPRE